MKDNLEFNFQIYSEQEADRFISEYPVIKSIGNWHVRLERQWDGSNPSENWYALNYGKTEETPSSYYSLERVLHIVGGYHESFLLAKIQGPNEINADKAIDFLKKIYQQRLTSGRKLSTIVEGEISAEMLFDTGIMAATNRHGDLFHYGCNWSIPDTCCTKNEVDYYKRQMSKFTGR